MMEIKQVAWYELVSHGLISLCRCDCNSNPFSEKTSQFLCPQVAFPWMVKRKSRPTRALNRDRCQCWSLRGHQSACKWMLRLLLSLGTQACVSPATYQGQVDLKYPWEGPRGSQHSCARPWLSSLLFPWSEKSVSFSRPQRQVSDCICRDRLQTPKQQNPSQSSGCFSSARDHLGLCSAEHMSRSTLPSAKEQRESFVGLLVWKVISVQPSVKGRKCHLWLVFYFLHLIAITE